jgi:hypothetical protein
VTTVAAKVRLVLAGLTACAVALGACGGSEPHDPQPPPPSLLPADYPLRFVEVRDCRRSVEHGLVNILIRTDSVMAPIYESGPYPFPVGTLVVKEEYAGANQGCTQRVGTTLMRKEAPGYDPAHNDWHWQRLDAAGTVVLDGRGSGGLAACASCHAGKACRGRDFTCAEP